LAGPEKICDHIAEIMDHFTEAFGLSRYTQQDEFFMVAEAKQKKCEGMEAMRLSSRISYYL
jgi:hypothetical protein